MDSERATNILGQPLETCSLSPMTGFQRDGHCRMPAGDFGRHGVCAELTEDFLEFTRGRGNDLSTPQPLFGFPGLKPGDRWCLCADRWAEAADMSQRCTAEWCEATEHFIDEINDALFTINEPRWASKESPKRMKTLKRRGRELCAQYKITAH